MKLRYAMILLTLFFTGCQDISSDKNNAQEEETSMQMQKLLDKYVSVTLKADLSHLSEGQREMIVILIEASKIIDELFWKQAWGNKSSLLDTITDHKTRDFAIINYGPWDRLNGNEPFIKGIGAKPLGANFYPVDMTKEEFEQSDLADKASLYTLLFRDEFGLSSKYYHEAYSVKVGLVATLLREAAKRAEDEGFKRYLNLRADALLNDDYRESDIAWLDMKDNDIDIVIGPIENYEDQLLGHKATS